MRNRILLTKPIFEWLIEHLVYMEENIEELVNFYYPYPSIEQENLKKFFKKYIRKIEAVLEKIEVINSMDKFRYTNYLNEFPFVIIGSHVNVIDLSNKSNTYYKIIHPLEQSKRKSEITYFSDLGKALILKEANHEVVINTPSELQSFKIMSIKLL